MQLKFSFCRRNILCDKIRFMNRMSIYNQNCGGFGIKHQLLQKSLEYLCIAAPFYQHELQFAIAANGRDHVHGVTLAGRSHDGCTSLRCPRRAGMVVTAHAGLVGKEQLCAECFGALTQGRQAFGHPVLHQAGILLIGTMQWPLRCKTQLRHDFPRVGKLRLILNSRSINCPIRRSVHKPKSKRNWLGVLSRTSIAIQRNCSAFTLGGRPAPSLANNPFCADCANVATHPNAARVGTLKNRATSATGIPLRTILTPWILFHCCSILRDVKTGR